VAQKLEPPAPVLVQLARPRHGPVQRFYYRKSFATCRRPTIPTKLQAEQEEAEYQ
jgi:hypothetical protein